MDYSNIENLSDEDILSLYDNIIEFEFISAGCIWKIECANGEVLYTCWWNCGSLPVGTYHYCTPTRCGNYSRLRVCGTHNGYEYLVKFDSVCDNRDFIRT